MRGRTWIWPVLLSLVVLAGCTGAASPTTGPEPTVTPPSTEASAGASVSADDPSLPRVDESGNYPADVLLAYIRAWNRRDWKTAYSLTAPPKEDFAALTAARSADAVPWDDFTIHETRIVAADKALVRVTYATVGFSSLEGLKPEEARRAVVVREPGEWWVLEKHDGLWMVTHKGPND